MKNQSKCTLLLLGLLIGGACKKQIEPDISAPTCLVATQTIKQLAKPNQLLFEPEMVDINGESLQVSTIQKSVYNYDAQGRITTEYNIYEGGKADSVFYKYKSDSVSIQTVMIATTGRTVQTQEVALNSQGLADKQEKLGYVPLYTTYDKYGYLVSQKGEFGTITIDNGNVIEKLILDHDAGPSYIYRYEYNLNKSGLTPVQTFYGRESRNLLSKYTIQQNGPFSIYPNVYEGTYTYTYDGSGRVKRQILQGKQGEPISFLYDVDKVVVKDFSYTCQ